MVFQLGSSIIAVPQSSHFQDSDAADADAAPETFVRTRPESSTAEAGSDAREREAERSAFTASVLAGIGRVSAAVPCTRAVREVPLEPAFPPAGAAPDSSFSADLAASLYGAFLPDIALGISRYREYPPGPWGKQDAHRKHEGETAAGARRSHGVLVQFAKALNDMTIIQQQRQISAASTVLEARARFPDHRNVHVIKTGLLDDLCVNIIIG